jgi:ADP-dependent NAD(P)H-hydrate dehydratase / NAD(P)H-hydrate epimerase
VSAPAPSFSPLLDADGMRGADRWAIEVRGIPSLELMETAGRAVAEAAAGLAGSAPICVVCGKGNNAGDGLVAARRLAELGYEADVLLLWPADELSPDSRTNLERLAGDAWREVDGGALAAALGEAGVVIDAIFGTGFEGAPRPPADGAVVAINDARARGARVVACDIPSGISAGDGRAEGDAVEADITVTFHGAKVGHRVAPGADHTGELRVADIGIPAEAPAEPAAHVIEDGILGSLTRRDSRSTKFTSGNVLVVGGSRGLTGAVCLASEAAIRAGAGYAAAAVPASLEPILEAKLTEVMTLGVAEAEGGLTREAAAAILARAETAGCVALGPGAGRSEETQELIRSLATEIEQPLLVDADGLTALGIAFAAAGREDRPLILTPHAGELARLLGSSSAEVGEARLRSAVTAARECGGIVVLKGADTIVTDGDRVAVNALPAPALATAGTGDVLSGTIAALVARGTPPFEACCAGVLAHARAGRIAARRVGAAESVVASDVIAALPAGLHPEAA